MEEVTGSIALPNGTDIDQNHAGNVNKIKKNIPKRKLHGESAMYRSERRKKSKSNISGIQQTQQAPFLRIRKKLDSSKLSEGVILKLYLVILCQMRANAALIIREIVLLHVQRITKMNCVHSKNILIFYLIIAVWRNYRCMQIPQRLDKKVQHTQ